MGVLALASVAVMFLVVSFTTSPNTLRGAPERVLQLSEVAAITQSGDCTCKTTCDQYDDRRGTFCEIGETESAGCLGADGYTAKTDEQGIIWAACRVVYGLDGCQDDPCENNGFCIDEDDSFKCKCRQGFTGDRCEEAINACVDFPCSVNAACTDHPAPAVNNEAGRQCTCHPGYVGDDGTCTDADACAIAPCQMGFANCVDLPPPAPADETGRACVCMEGFADPSGSGDFCVGIDACKTAMCDPQAICTDLPPPAAAGVDGRTCVCEDGFEGDGEQCKDIDACALHPCPADAACIDEPAPAGTGTAGRRCVCATGYGFDGTACVEVDACMDFPCEEDAVCSDLFAPAANNEKGRECRCNLGFMSDDITGRCVQADSCKHTVSFPCDENAECTDLPPPASLESGYTCTCRAGFYGDGTFCSPIDACAVGVDIDMTTGYVAPPTTSGGVASTESEGDGGTVTVYGTTREVMDAVQGSEQKEGYGSRQLTSVNFVQNAGVFGASENIGWHLSARFTISEATQLAFRIGAPFSRGGFVMLDSHIKDQAMRDISWDGDEASDNWSFQVEPASLRPGNHLLEVYGVDACCDEGLTIQMQVVGGPWLPMSSDNLQGLGSSPCEPHAECVDESSPAGFDGYQCICQPGYVLHPEKAVCEDLDACVTSPCDANAVCQDKPPPEGGGATGRVCTCKSGFYESVDANHQVGCTETDACEVSPCHRDAFCTDLGPPHEGDVTGRVCSCKPGYHGDGEMCTEIDACGGYPCSDHGICSDLPPPALNTPTGRKCSCDVGYTGDGESCAEADACIFAPCDVNAECVDLKAPAAASSSGRRCTCRDGFQGNGDACSQIDACTTNACSGDNVRCIDLPPPAHDDASGRNCVCLEGYEVAGSHLHGGSFDCVEVDACAPSAFPCGSPAGQCTDLPPPAGLSMGGRICTCDEGYIGDGEVCRDIDACVGNPCNPNAFCLDLPPPALGDRNGRECVCNSGYRSDSDGEACVAIDACLSHPCDVHARCVDAEAPQNENGYSCICGDGFLGDGHECTPIDACVTSPCNAMAMCTDLPPPYGPGPSGRVCECKPGYEGDGVSCSNVNGCKEEKCDPNAKCIDELPPSTGGSCVCNAGFNGDGYACLDIDDCEVHYDKSIDVTGVTESCAVVCVKSPNTGMGASCAAAESNGIRLDCNEMPPAGEATCYCENGGAHVGAHTLELLTPCQHGSCKDTGLNAYECTCEAGWSGRDCDEESAGDNCGAGTCAFGSCKDVGTDFVCLCNEGYSGKNCDVPPTNWVPLTNSGLGGGFFAAPKGWKLVRDGATYADGGAPSKLCANLGGGCMRHPESGPTKTTDEYGGSTGSTLDDLGDASMGPKYDLELVVASGVAAGTKDAIFITLFGDNGQTRPIRAFHPGADRSSRNTVSVYAADVGVPSNIEYYTSGNDDVSPVSLRVVLQDGTDFSMDGDDTAFDAADAKNSQTYPLFDASAMCSEYRYSVECPVLDLMAGATFTASSELDSYHLAAHARVGHSEYGWAPKNKANGEWLQVDLGADSWVDTIEVLAGDPTAAPCPEGEGIYAIQPPICCGYLSTFKIVAKTSAMASWFTLGTYEGDCARSKVIFLDEPIQAKLLQVIVQDVSKVHFPALRIRVSGASVFGAANVLSSAGLTHDIVSKSCQCWADHGSAAFAPGGLCNVAAHPAQYANVCLRPAEPTAGCSLKVKTCSHWGVGFLNGEDLWGETHKDRDGFMAIALTGVSQEACLRRAYEVYQFCKNSGDSDDVRVLATYEPTGARRTYPGRIAIVDATYGGNCRYDVKTTRSVGHMGCRNYCAQGHESVAEGSTCVAQHDEQNDRWIDCDAVRGEADAGVACYCRLPDSEGTHGVLVGNVNLPLEVSCGGKVGCSFDALLLGDRDATSCDEGLEVSYQCNEGDGGIVRTASVPAVEAFPTKTEGKCDDAWDTNLPLDAWGSSGSDFRASTPDDCKAICRQQPKCLGVQWYDNAMAQTNCVPVMRHQLRRTEGKICMIQDVPPCDDAEHTVNCNSWSMTYSQCKTKCVRDSRCIGFSFTNDEWNIAHSAGCVVWDYEKAEACDSPKSEASWDTYRLTRDNEIGCFSNVAEMLVESLTMAQQTVNWDQCKELASKAEMVYFAIADSKDGVTGKCVGGSTITDDYRGLSNTCLNICTEANKCTNADGSTSNTDSNGHHVGVGNLGEVYSVPATSMQPQPGSDFTCFSKSAQVATLDCSSKLKFADYHQVPGPAQ